MSGSFVTPAALPDAQVGVAYAQLIVTAWAPPPFLPIILRFEPVGNNAGQTLPAGLSFYYNGGGSLSATLAGTPANGTEGTTYQFKVYAYEPNDEANAISQVFTLRVLPPLRIECPDPLPIARAGLDYALANVQPIGTGGNVSVAPGDGQQLPFVWSLAGGPPPGLQIDPVTGKLFGVIASDACGDYPFTIEAVQANATDVTGSPLGVQIDRVLTVSSLPTGQDLAKRLPPNTISGCTLEVLDGIASAALQIITDFSGVPFANCTPPRFTDEVVDRNSYSSLAFTRYRPVQQLVAADDFGQTMRVGTLAQVVRGDADVGVDRNGLAVRFARPAACDGPSGVVLTYDAGFAILPRDLYEVFIQLALLLFQERGRIGISKLSVGESQTEYIRDLPPWCMVALSRYQVQGNQL